MKMLKKKTTSIMMMTMMATTARMMRVQRNCFSVTTEKALANE